MDRVWFAIAVLALAGCWLTGGKPPSPPSLVVHVSPAPDTLPMTTEAKLAVLKDVAATGKAVGNSIEATGTTAHSPEGRTNLEAWQIAEKWAGGGGTPQSIAALWQRLTTAEADAKLQIDAYRQAAAQREKEIANLVTGAQQHAADAVALKDELAKTQKELADMHAWREKVSWTGLGIFALVSLAATIYLSIRWPIFAKYAATGWLLVNASGAIAVFFAFYKALIITAAWIAGGLLVAVLVGYGVAHAWRARLDKSLVLSVDAGLKALPKAQVIAFKAAANKFVPDKDAKDKLVKQLQQEK